MLGDGQPQASAGGGITGRLARARAVRLEEALEYARQVVIADADARISHMHYQHRLRLILRWCRLRPIGGCLRRRWSFYCGADRDAPTGARIFETVVDEVDEHLADAIRVRPGVWQAVRHRGVE